MFPITQTQSTFESGNKTVRLDCFVPTGNGQRFPAVIRAADALLAITREAA